MLDVMWCVHPLVCIRIQNELVNMAPPPIGKEVRRNFGLDPPAGSRFFQEETQDILFSHGHGAVPAGCGIFLGYGLGDDDLLLARFRVGSDVFIELAAHGVFPDLELACQFLQEGFQEDPVIDGGDDGKDHAVMADFPSRVVTSNCCSARMSM